MKAEVFATALPATALLQRYSGDAGYTDAYVADVDRDVPFARFVEAFYTTRLFALERLVLAALGRPSTAAQAGALARGECDRFAAWRVEAREDAQLLLADDTGRTRSWLLAEALAGGGTRLYFGSAVVARGRKARRGLGFTALLGFHRAYSRALLRAALRALH